MAGILGCLGVILGATGKHALEGKVDEELSSGFETGLRYHQTHGVALLAVTLFSLCLLVLGARNISLFRDGLSSWHSGLLRQFVSYGIHGYFRFWEAHSCRGILLILGWLSLALVGFFEPKPEANSP